MTWAKMKVLAQDNRVPSVILHVYDVSILHDSYQIQGLGMLVRFAYLDFPENIFETHDDETFFALSH